MLERPQRYVNFGRDGDCIFATATCLDFVHAFAAPDARDLMALSLLDDCRRYDAPLSTFVVMPHHIHFIAVVPLDKTASWLLNRIKSNSARRVLRILDEPTRRRFDEQRGLNDRTFWMRGFRSFPITSSEMFRQKANYVHENPVRAEYCREAQDYRWSSAWAWEKGLWDSEAGLDLEKVMEPFEAMRPFMELSKLGG